MATDYAVQKNMPSIHTTSPAAPLSSIVFARYPEEGRVKTRLAASIGGAQACALYRAMMLDTIERIARRGRPVTVCVSPPGRCSDFRRLLGDEGLLLSPAPAVAPQQGATLGDRMLNAFRSAQRSTGLPAVILGTDSPTLPERILDETEQALASGAAAVLGPSDDGGFYLLALTGICDDCFFGDDYSNSTVFARTHDALLRRFGAVSVLPAWYDIDDADGLARLRGERDIGATAPRTAAALHNLRQ